ncbi:(Fe-S)-binding protein [bacterium]|nr:(Fe-S)-binding protein [bacterium]
MKTLKDFEKELNKCSKCGLCQSACPIFQVNPNDCAVSKGKFIMLHGVTKGDLKLSKNINNYLDMCLKCGKCNNFCPSGIDVCRIINSAKYEYMKTTFTAKIINILESRMVFGSFIKLGALISKPFRPKYKASKDPTTSVVYFKGCVNQICPKTDKYIHKIFKNIPIEIIEPDFDCCGLPFLSEGNLERFEQAAKYNSKLLNSCTDYNYIITDCASCESTIKEYPKYINFDNNINVYNWGNLIALLNIKFKFNNPIRVTFHRPCHLENDVFINQIFKNCENINYIQMEDYDNCCGLAGSFAIKNHKQAKQLISNKAKNISITEADYVITTCPSCIIGLKLGLAMIGNKKTKVVSLLEFLSKADNIVY